MPVDPDAYKLVSDGLIDFFVDALSATADGKAAFDDPGDQLKTYLTGDDKHLTQIQIAKLLAATCFRMHEKARVGMAEEDMRPAVEDDAVEMAKDLLKTKSLLLG